MTAYRYITAADWGGEWVRPPQHEQPNDPEVYVHHTMGNPMSDRPAEDAFQALNAYATRPKPEGGKGYSFLDYDYLVHWEAAKDLFTIGEGRGAWLSAATKNRNELGEAICVLGSFHPGSIHSQRPKPGHIEATSRGIVHMIEAGLAARDAEILGHFQNKAYPTPQTTCPGDYLIPHLPDIRSRVAELLNPPSPPPAHGGNMRSIRGQVVDRDGNVYENQIVGTVIANPPQLVTLGIDKDRMFRFEIDGTREDIEYQLGIKLTPSK